MDPQRWSRLSSLLDELLDLDPAPRERRLDEIGAEDTVLATELRDWLARDAEQPQFLAEPIVNASAFAPQPGQTLGPYRLESLLGEGGMGQVWLAIRADGLYQRRVALKLLRPGLGDAGLRARFTRERQILARLGHAHIARLLDAGLTQDGQPYLALDYVQGQPITGYAEAMGLEVAARLDLFLQVCAAVSHAHANLVVHRDLKPSNILVTAAGEVCLLDFGIAKLLDEPAGADITRTGARAFTLHYAAPEQLRNEPVTTMTDVYALGVVLYELLVGAKPYLPSRSSDAAWEEAILTAEAVPPSQALARLGRERKQLGLRRRAAQLHGDLDNILLKALAKSPEQRYASVEALAQDLRRHLSGQPVQARPQSLGYRVRKYLRRHSVALLVVMVVAGVLGAAVAVLSWQAERALAEAARAQAMQDFVIALFEQTDRAGSDQGLDVRTLLDAGVRRADTELTAQPQSRAELLGLIARLRLGLGDDRETLDLLARQAALLPGLASVEATRIGLESAPLQGRSLRELGRAADCVAALAPWLQRSRALARDYPLAVAELQSQLGRCQVALGRHDIARGLFSQALALRRNTPGAGPAEAESQADLAVLLAETGHSEEALSAMDGALRLLRRNGGDRNALGVQVWQGLGALHRATGDPQESEAAYRQALEIALSRFGVAHPATAAVQRPLGALLLDQGRFEEAERLLQAAQEQLQRQLGEDHPEITLTTRLLARARAELGRSAAALADYEQVLSQVRRDGDASALADTLCPLARIAMEAGERARAEAYADECRQQASRIGSPRALDALNLLAELELARGNARAAAAWLDTGLDETRLGADQQGQRELLRARTASLLGDLDAAQQRLAPLLPGPAGPGPRTDLHWQATALKAALLCRSGQREPGVQLRERGLASLARTQPERLRLRRVFDALSAACMGR